MATPQKLHHLMSLQSNGWSMRWKEQWQFDIMDHWALWQLTLNGPIILKRNRQCHSTDLDLQHHDRKIYRRRRIQLLQRRIGPHAAEGFVGKLSSEWYCYECHVIWMIEHAEGVQNEWRNLNKNILLHWDLSGERSPAVVTRLMVENELTSEGPTWLDRFALTWEIPFSVLWHWMIEPVRHWMVIQDPGGKV